MDRVTEIPQLDGWIPIRFYWEMDQPIVDWCCLRELRFTDPFFSDTIEACFRRPANLLFRHQTHIDVLERWQQIRPGVRPTGFIFHMSRCGSTLIGQMLASLSQNIVISEAGLIDSILRSHYRNPNVTDNNRIAWLQWTVNALAQPRAGEKHFFIKFDAWNTLDLPLVRKAFPDVPWIFLYRDPVEVMVSQLGHRGSHMIPGLIDPRIFGMELSAPITIPPEEYCARVLASICQAGLQYHHVYGGTLINYSQLPEAVWTTLLKLFKVALTNQDLEKMKAAAGLDAKNAVIAFEKDSAKKKAKASPAAREAVEKWLDPVYEQLEAARVGHGSPPGGAQKGDAEFKGDLTQKIAVFLKEIGLEIVSTRITSETFLPGILVAQGKLLIDEDQLLWPGDLLHEAGHLAVASAELRPTLTGEVILPDANLDAIESQAIAWSYAASLHLGLDPKTVFHEGGYRGQSAALLMNFEVGVPLGVNGLQEAGMTMIENAAREGVRPYPHMLKWLRD